MNDILLRLAAGSASAKELKQFFNWVQDAGPDHVMKTLVRLRDLSRDAQKELTQVQNPAVASKTSAEDARIAEHMPMIKSVERLLLQEAGLSKSTATRALISELRNVPTEYGYLSSPAKVSFRSWLARIGEDVSDSRVLHVASRIRNEVVHGSKSVSDWPLS